MKIAKSSWIIKAAYFPETVFREDWKIPDRTNVCSLVSRIVFLPPVFACFCCIVGPIFGAIWVCSKVSETRLWSKLNAPIPKSALVELVGRRVSDWKEGVCTIVEIEK